MPSGLGLLAILPFCVRGCPLEDSRRWPNNRDDRWEDDVCEGAKLGVWGGAGNQSRLALSLKQYAWRM